MKRTLRAQSDFKSVILRNQLTSLVLFEAITTTKAKSADFIPFANRFFNRVKIADLNAKKLAHSTLLDKNAVAKLFEEVLPRYEATETTFVRSYRVMPRRGDNAPQVMVALLKPLSAKPEQKSETKKSATKTKETA